MLASALFLKSAQWLRSRLVAGLWVGLWAWPVAGWAQQAAQSPQLSLARVSLGAGMHKLDVQVAQTAHERQMGLMFRQEMPAHEGMLFVFEQPSIQCFWMRNTWIALTAAFVADDGTIVNLADMQPRNDQSHCSHQPVRYVLEMNRGWFAKRQIGKGYKLRGPMWKP